jgi:hypothetical protein
LTVLEEFWGKKRNVSIPGLRISKRQKRSKPHAYVW